MYLFDENTSIHLIKFMREIGFDVCHMTEAFSSAARDIDWIPEAAKRGMVAVSSDHNIRKNPVERAALIEHKLNTLFLPSWYNSKSSNIWRQSWWTIKTWPSIEENLKKARTVGIRRITDNGRLEDY